MDWEPILTAAGTAVAVTLGVRRIAASCETRNDKAHTELRAAIDTGFGKVNDHLLKVVEDVAYMRGRQDERDRRRTAAP